MGCFDTLGKSIKEKRLFPPVGLLCCRAKAPTPSTWAPMSYFCPSPPLLQGLLYTPTQRVRRRRTITPECHFHSIIRACIASASANMSAHSDAEWRMRDADALCSYRHFGAKVNYRRNTRHDILTCWDAATPALRCLARRRAGHYAKHAVSRVIA